MVASFSEADVPPQRGKVVLVTGGNAGIGRQVAKVLLAKGAQVIIAGRSESKVNEAVKALGDCSGEVVDLSSFASVTAFAQRVRAAHSRIDVLVNNAGVFLPPHSKTPEGFEVTLGTNAVGTNQLLPLVAASPTGRIVVLSSDAINCTSSKKPWARLEDVGGKSVTKSDLAAYGDSKLLNALWAQGLQKALRSSPKTAHVLVASCHPGPVKTDIFNKIDTSGSCLAAVFKAIVPLAAIPVTTGALSSLYCATAAGVAPGAMYTRGPRVAPFPLEKHKHYSEENVQRSFDAINAAIVAASGPAFQLPA